jgi:hypothetical protein
MSVVSQKTADQNDQNNLSDDEESQIYNGETQLNEDDEDDEEDDEEEDEDQEGGNMPIDLSQNEIYRGVCTLLEDDDGNNILEYISLLHTELIGINKSMENLRGIRKELTRIADVAELMVKSSKSSSVDDSESKKSERKVKKSV